MIGAERLLKPKGELTLGAVWKKAEEEETSTTSDVSTNKLGMFVRPGLFYRQKNLQKKLYLRVLLIKKAQNLRINIANKDPALGF